MTEIAEEAPGVSVVSPAVDDNLSARLPPLPLKPLRQPRRVLGAALGLGVAAELFFDGKPLSFTFPLFVALTLAALAALAGREGRYGARHVLWLAGPLLTFAVFAGWRGDELALM